MQQIELTIPEPCHEDWQQMTPTQQGRFCNACAKQVVDFSTMTDTQVLNYFSSIKNEKVCGRAYPDQLDRMIALPKEPTKRLFWHWNYITMLFLFFGKTNNAKAQGGLKVIKTIQADSIKLQRNFNINNVLAGKINGQTFSVENSTTPSIIIGGISSIVGGKEPLYVIDGIPFSGGLPATFNSAEIDKISILKTNKATAIFGSQAAAGAIVITTKKTEYKKMDTVVINSGYVQGRIQRCSAVGGMVAGVTVKRSFIDSIRSVQTKFTRDLKIYPSPVRKGNPFTIALILKQAGSFNIQLIDAAGLIVLQKQSTATTKQYIEQVQTGKDWSSGVYYIRIFDSNNKLISTSNFLIQ